jgi:hypothetical protein
MCTDKDIPGCTSKLHPHIHPAHKHHLSTFSPRCVHTWYGQLLVGHIQEEAHAGFTSGLKISGAGNSRISVSVRGLEGEQRIQVDTTPQPLSFLTLWGE